MYEVTMPKLSDSMEVGKIIEWKVKEGDQVHAGDVLAEVESDKAVMELECFRDGMVNKIVYGDDEEVSVGDVIALIADEGESAVAAEVPSEEAPKPKREKDSAEPTPEPAAPRPAPTPAPTAGARIAISPYARKLAEQHDVDVSALTGTGPGGRIIAKDVEAAMSGAPAGEAAPPAPPAKAGPVPERRPVPAPTPDEELPPIEVGDDEADVQDAPFRMKTVARRVIASQHAIPHFYITRGIEVSALIQRREALKEEMGATITHLLVLACATALRAHPDVNRTYDHGRVISWKHINIGLAVDTDQGLTVAVLRQAEDLPLKEIVDRSGELVERARSGKLTADERRHPGFTITNLGMFDVEHFEPIINPPSSITLAVASALPAPVADGDAFRIGRVMKLTAACDHRIIDGATAARFLMDLRKLLENPDALLGETK